MNYQSSIINHHSINCRGKLIDLSTPKIMGILNLTPDSFSDGGKFNDEKSALLQAEKMIKDGADFIDIGAQSTRPNADFLSARQEILRIGNVIYLIKKEFPETLISLDTFSYVSVCGAHRIQLSQQSQVLKSFIDYQKKIMKNSRIQFVLIRNIGQIVAVNIMME